MVETSYMSITAQLCVRSRINRSSVCGMLACAEFGGISCYFCMCHVIGWLEARWKVDVRVECLLPDVEGLDPLGWVHVVYYVHAMDPPLCHTLQDTQPLSLQ